MLHAADKLKRVVRWTGKARDPPLRCDDDSLGGLVARLRLRPAALGNDRAYLGAQAIGTWWNDLASFAGVNHHPDPAKSSPIPVHPGAAQYYADPVKPAATMPTLPANPLDPTAR